MAPLRTLAALALAGSASAFAPNAPLATKTVAPVRYALDCNSIAFHHVEVC